MAVVAMEVVLVAMEEVATVKAMERSRVPGEDLAETMLEAMVC